MPTFSRIADVCDAANTMLGKAVRWFSLLMVLMMCFNVATRYLFASGLPWQQELVRYFHAVLFLAAAGYTLKSEGHVRVDVFYQNFTPTRRAWVNLLGTIGLLFPFAVALVYFSWDYVLNAWAIQEGSSEYRGMPGVFLLKSCIWLAAGTLMLQGVSVICHSLMSILGHEKRKIFMEEERA